MASILKVDTLQKPDGSTPTAADLGIDVAGSVKLLATLRTSDYNIYSTAVSDTFTTHKSITVTPSNPDSQLVIRGHYLIRAYAGTNLRVTTRILVDGSDLAATTGESYDLAMRYYRFDTTDIMVTQPASYVVPSSMVDSSVTIDFQVADGTGTVTEFIVAQMAMEIYEILP
jgi:hypothetical protein